MSVGATERTQSGITPLQLATTSATLFDKCFYDELQEESGFRMYKCPGDINKFNTEINKFNAAIFNLDATTDSNPIKFCRWINGPESKPLAWESVDGTFSSLSVKDAKSARKYFLIKLVVFVVGVALVVFSLVSPFLLAPLLPLTAVTALSFSCGGVGLVITPFHMLCSLFIGSRIAKIIKVTTPALQPAELPGSESARLLDQRQDADAVKV